MSLEPVLNIDYDRKTFEFYAKIIKTWCISETDDSLQFDKTLA